MSRKTLIAAAGGLAGICVVLGAVSLTSWLHVRSASRDVPPDPTPAPIALLRAPIPPGPQSALLEHGRALTIAGDCVSCHTRIGGLPFEGGLGLQTPYGVIFSSNITSDPVHGIGGWSADDFWRLMSRGIAPHGRHVYPAMPYNYYTRITRADSDAIFAYLKSLPASAHVPPDNLLPWPFTFRPVLIGWNLLFLNDAREQPDPGHDALVDRGAALVDGLGHCGACHTPLTLAGSPQTDRALQGARLNGWMAPDLTANPRTGLGRWSVDDIVAYLRDGRNAHAAAGGPMAEVVSYSTSSMSEDDLRAIAAYLKSLPPSPARAVSAPEAGAMRRGGAIYADVCSACHLPDGRGQPGFFPPLSGSASLQQDDPRGIVHVILAGARTAPTPRRPSPLAMPSFAWKLTDQDVADVASYVRNSWGNSASAVTADQVAAERSAGALRNPLP